MRAMVSLMDNLVGVDSGASCPRLQIYNDGTGLVIEYPWFTREVGEGGEDESFVGRAISKVTSTLHHMTPHAQLGMDLAVVGGIVCGSLVGIMTAGPVGMGSIVGSAVKTGLLSGLFC